MVSNLSWQQTPPLSAIVLGGSLGTDGPSSAGCHPFPLTDCRQMCHQAVALAVCLGTSEVKG